MNNNEDISPYLHCVCVLGVPVLVSACTKSYQTTSQYTPKRKMEGKGITTYEAVKSQKSEGADGGDELN